MLKIGINGAAGQMGRRLTELVTHSRDFILSCALETSGHESLGRDAGDIAGVGSTGVMLSSALDEETDVLIDFSAPAATLVRLDECVDCGVAMVIGTTGFDASGEGRIRAAAEDIPIVMAPNMSLGVNLLFALAGKVAGALGESYDIEIVEAHHRHKKDAPSGTAMQLAKNICEAMSWEPVEDHLVHGREGQTGERPEKQIGMHAIRGGEVVGEHTVIFAGTGERVELAHKAESRDVFAQGALHAALFVAKQEKGLYTMQDVLGL
jgi:4-hydroxy-tetrahydrodipicolinate reductase